MFVNIKIGFGAIMEGAAVLCYNVVMTSTPSPGSRPSVKIAYIGGGSRYWARDLMKDLALQAPFDGEIALYDLDLSAARKNVAIAERLFAREDVVGRFRVVAVETLAACLEGADFVVLSIEPGPMECRFADLEIPLKYGIIQPVGDTTGPGGILRALRSIPTYVHFARQIMKHCPRAWVINYTNPMTLCTRALYAAEPAIKAFGCCHEVFGAQRRLLDLAVRESHEGPAATRRDLIVDVIGVNHFTWITQAHFRGQDVLARFKEQSADPATYFDATEKSLERVRDRKYFGGEYLVSHDLMRRFGAMAAAGNRHLVEFVPWYVESEAVLHRWGVVCTPYEHRISSRANEDVAADVYAQNEINPSGEEGVQQMAAILGLGDLRTNINLPNRGQAPGLSLNAVVETNALFSHDCVEPLVSQSLPAGANQLVQRIVDVQELTLAATLENDRDMAFQALLCDPLVRISTDAAHAMFTEMLDHVAGVAAAAGEGALIGV